MSSNKKMVKKQPIFKNSRAATRLYLEESSDDESVDKIRLKRVKLRQRIAPPGHTFGWFVEHVSKGTTVNGSIIASDQDVSEKINDFTDFMQKKVAAARKEKDDAAITIKRLKVEHRELKFVLSQTSIKYEKAKKDREQAIEEKKQANDELESVKKERDDALRRLECFCCFSHEDALHAFIPCGHMICTACKDDHPVDTPCAKCNVKIMGRVQLYN